MFGKKRRWFRSADCVINIDKITSFNKCEMSQLEDNVIVHVEGQHAITLYDTNVDDVLYQIEHGKQPRMRKNKLR